MPGPDPDRRRSGPAACGGGCAGSDRHHQPAARLHRQARRDRSTSTARKTSPSCSTTSRRSCIWSRQIRDEAHRFAVTFHRTRRNAARLTSELDQIPGVGEITVRKLLKEFGSSTMVREASEEELTKRVGKAAARKVRAYYSPKPQLCIAEPSAPPSGNKSGTHTVEFSSVQKTKILHAELFTHFPRFTVCSAERIVRTIRSQRLAGRAQSSASSRWDSHIVLRNLDQ